MGAVIPVVRVVVVLLLSVVWLGVAFWSMADSSKWLALPVIALSFSMAVGFALVELLYWSEYM